MKMAITFTEQPRDRAPGLIPQNDCRRFDIRMRESRLAWRPQEVNRPASELLKYLAEEISH